MTAAVELVSLGLLPLVMVLVQAPVVEPELVPVLGSEMHWVP